MHILHLNYKLYYFIKKYADTDIPNIAGIPNTNPKINGSIDVDDESELGLVPGLVPGLVFGVLVDPVSESDVVCT